MATDLNLDNIPKELKIILEIIKSENVENWQPLLKNIDWTIFLDQALHHRLHPLIAPQLKKLDKAIIPNFVMETINQAYRINTLNMLRLSGEMGMICELFNKRDIPILALKGPVLGIELYGDVSLRASSDLDLLIPINELEKANELLLNCGYQKDDYIKTVLNDWKWRHHHVTYIHPVSGIKVEIHWRLNPGPGKEPSFSELWDRRRKSSLTSYPVYYLGNEDLFLFLVSHGARHGWSRLRWLVDIDRITAKQKIDWIFLGKILKKYQYQHIGGQALILSSELLNTSITKEMEPLTKDKLAKRLAQAAVFYLETMINLHTDPVPEAVSQYHKSHLFLLRSKRQKLLFILSFLYPYPEDSEILPLPKSLHILYFPLRPFLWLCRRSRKHVLS